MSAGETLNITLRPREFSEVIGLESELTTLRSKIDKGEIPRAFLFKGPFGCGKTTLAYIVARAIQGWDFVGNPIVQEINAANMTGVSDMRTLVEGTSAYPMTGKYRVIILDEAHKLSSAAQELLLKEFEIKNSPTVWIICSSNSDKLIEGLRAGRLFTIEVRGMGEKERKELIARAVQETGHGDASDFIQAVEKSKITSPRKILMAFDLYHNGMSPAQALAAYHFEALPEYFEIAMGVVFGQWDKGYILPWIKEKDGSAKQFKAVGEQLKALDDKLKKKPKDDSAVSIPEEETETSVEEDDVQGRPETARALRAIVAASLKNQVFKGGAKATKGSAALFKLAHCVSSNPFDAGSEWACTIGGLFSVNQIMGGKV